MALEPARQFFEDEKGQLSMSRLLMFLSFFPASIVVLMTHNENTLGWYIGGYVLGYVGGKGTEIWRDNRNNGDHHD